MEKDKRKKRFILYKWILLIAIVPFIEVLVIIVIDCNPEIVKWVPHSSKKDVWLQIGTAILAAAPGTFCGILALLQTQRLHDMEDWYRRPILIMRDAKLGLLLCGNPYFRYEQYPAGEREYFERVNESLSFDTNREGILSINLELELKSEPVIEKIEIRDIEFEFPNCSKLPIYPLNVESISTEMREEGGDRYSFQSIYDQGNICYKISSDIYVGQKIESINFWNAISGFLDYANEPRKIYSTMNTKVILKVYHKYAFDKFDLFLLNIHWNACPKNTRREAYMEQQSKEFVCSYINNMEMN